MAHQVGGAAPLRPLTAVGVRGEGGNPAPDSSLEVGYHCVRRLGPRITMFTDPTWFTVSLIVSAIGFVLANYGRKMRRWPQGVAGAVLMVYSYFVPSPLLMAGIGAGILIVLLIVLRLGW